MRTLAAADWGTSPALQASRDLGASVAKHTCFAYCCLSGGQDSVAVAARIQAPNGAAVEVDEDVALICMRDRAAHRNASTTL